MIPSIYNKEFSEKYGDLVGCIRGVVVEERNGLFEAELEYTIFSPYWEKLSRGNIIVADANDTLKKQKFRVYHVSKAIGGRFKVIAKHISYDLARDMIEDLNIERQSCEYCLNQIFRTSQFSTHYRGYSDIVNVQSYKMNSVKLLRAIVGESGSIIDTFGTGAEILRDNEKFHVLNRRGHDNDVVIEYGKNLTGLDITEDDSDMITRIKPYAKYSDEQGQECIVYANPKYIDSPLINHYETPFVAEVDFSSKFEDDEIPTSDKLRNLSQNYFIEKKCDIPKSTYKVAFIPLSKCVGYEGIEDKISLCDTVTIRDYRYNMDTKAKVIKTTYDFLTERYESMEVGAPKTTLGDIVGGSNTATQGPPGPVGPQGPAGADGSIGDFPNTLPQNPVITSRLYGFASIELSWTFENKVYYSYELYASKTKGFAPNTFNLLFAGQASTFLHQVKPTETWYYRVCALNSHGQRTEFSEECKVDTVKINDLSDYVESASIGDALIGKLSLDRGWVGQLHGNWIDAKQLSVTDGNGKRTLDIDSFGNVRLDVTELSIKANQVATLTDVDGAKKELSDKVVEVKLDVDGITNEVSSIKDSSFGGNNLVKNGNFDNGTSIWQATKYSGQGIYEFAVFNEDNSNSWCLNNKKIGWCSAESLPVGQSITGEWALCQEFDTVIGETYTISYYISGHRSSKSVVVRNGLGTSWNDVSDQKWYGHLDGGKSSSGWAWDSITFVAQHTKSVIWFRMHSRISEYDNENSMYLWVTDVCCIEGKMSSKWIPNIDEYYNRTETNTVIKQTADGIKETLNKSIETSQKEAVEQANLNTENKLQSYPTKTEMSTEIDKRADGFYTEVKKIENTLSIDNIIANGNFIDGYYGWNYSDHGQPINYEITNQGDWVVDGKYALLLTQSNHAQGYDSGFYQTFYTKWYTNYTITGYIASHRAEGMVIIKDDAGNWLNFDKTNPDSDDYTGGKDITKWKRVKFTVYSGERGRLSLNLAMARSGSNGHVWFHDFMVVEGTEEYPWIPSTREFNSKFTQTSELIKTKVSVSDFWTHIEQNPYSVMIAINNGRSNNGIEVDSEGVSVFENNLKTILLNSGKMHVYNSLNGDYMGYFGTVGDDLRTQLHGTNTFSIMAGDDNLKALEVKVNRGQSYGNAMVDICGGVVFTHRPGQDVGFNGILLGNDDRSDAYGYHNMSIACWNSLGFQDNYGYTHMFMDVRRGRLIMKGGLYQNTQTPPSAYILSNDERNPFYSGVTAEAMVNSILNLETTVKVDTDDDVTMMILDNDDNLTMSMIDNQPHVDIASIVAGLVETVKYLKAEIDELKS